MRLSCAGHVPNAAHKREISRPRTCVRLAVQSDTDGERDKSSGRLLFRIMRVADDGLPSLTADGKGLRAREGVGPLTDIPVHEGRVNPSEGGISVTPDSPENFRSRPWLLPRSMGGKGRHPMWSIREGQLGPGLRFRPDPGDPYTHGFIEPARSMQVDDYQRLLEETRRRWARVV